MRRSAVVPIVALVASAGGLDALTRVLSRLPTGFPAAVIILQHLQPDRVSQLTGLLGGQCALPVREVEDDELVERGIVYVAPPGKHVLHTVDGRLALIVSGAFPPHRPSADLLLVSLALTAGPRVITAVLSGLGSDGATGATAVQDFGGTVLAANEASSREYAMPAATIGRGDALDQEMHVDEIADALISLTAALASGSCGD